MGACARNMQSDPAEIKPAQCCIKLVFSFDLYYDTRKHKIKLKIFFNVRISEYKKKLYILYHVFGIFEKIKVILKLVIYSTGLRFIRYALCKVTFTRIMEYSALNKENKHGE